MSSSPLFSCTRRLFSSGTNFKIKRLGRPSAAGALRRSSRCEPETHSTISNGPQPIGLRANGSLAQSVTVFIACSGAMGGKFESSGECACSKCKTTLRESGVSTDWISASCP